MTLKPATPLKLARVQAGVTQVALARVLGLTKQRVSQLEEGQGGPEGEARYREALAQVVKNAKGPGRNPGPKASTTDRPGYHPRKEAPSV